MNTRPIVLVPKMVREILHDGKRTIQRVITPQPCLDTEYDRWRWMAVEGKRAGIGYAWDGKSKEAFSEMVQACPICQVGDILWVREPYAQHPVTGKIVYQADAEEVPYGDGFDWKPDFKPAMLMPQELSRLSLRVTNVVAKAVSGEEALTWVWEITFETRPSENKTCGGAQTLTAGKLAGIMYRANPEAEVRFVFGSEVYYARGKLKVAYRKDSANQDVVELVPESFIRMEEV